MIFCITHELSVAEEVDPLGVDGLAVLGPGEGGHGVALDRRRDPQLLTLVHRHVAQRTAEENRRDFALRDFVAIRWQSDNLNSKACLLAFSDSHPTLYVVPGRVKPVLRGPNSTEPNLFKKDVLQKYKFFELMLTIIAGEVETLEHNSSGIPLNCEMI